MHVAILTAGGAGMFCGSCMHDNSWARMLRDAGEEVTLIPTYTPLTLDEADESERRVFLGGINLYLEHRSRLWGKLPKALTRVLDAPWVLRAASKLGVSNDAAGLGELTVDLLRGERGPQRREIEELVDFLAEQLQPDAVVFSNALIVGPLRELRKRYDGPIWCTLQGDDLFINDLPEPHRTRAIEEIRERSADFDGFLTHSEYYADHMSALLGLPRAKFRRVPLGIDADRHGDPPPKAGDADGTVTVGYFARVCPEKGLHALVPAVRAVRERHPNVRLVAGGYLGKRDAAYFKRLVKDARDLGDAFEYAGSPATAGEKAALYRRFDLLSVPTTYREPKGLPVLEAWSHGLPVVQPDHGAFGELLAGTGGGLLFRPGDVGDLAEQLGRLVADAALRHSLGTAGYHGVRETHGPAAVVAATRAVLTPRSAGFQPAPAGAAGGKV